MHEFPEFMRNAANAVKRTSRAGGMEGYVWDGADGSQVVLWHCRDGGRSEMHAHDFDEYALVVQGTFTGTAGGKPVTVGPGDECFIPAGVPHDGEYSADYRAIDAFGARRVEREQA
jgi:quercetin dioxygenase-like cupin family protein